MARPVLRVEKLGIVFGGLCALADFDCSLDEGELVGLIGPNGAGKTTVFNLLSGLYKPSSGRIDFSPAAGSTLRLDRMKSHAISRSGLARTFQNIRLFKELSVIDNVRIALHPKVSYGAVSCALRLPAFGRGEEKMEGKALEILSIFGIADKAREISANLPYGEQRKLEIVRALATDPELLLLDEPAAGMNPQETNNLMELISFIRERFKLTILLIEHDMNLVMGICERLIVLDYGRVIARGKPESVRTDPLVVEAYLGREGGVRA
jgi:branched-chain amino acid transport system ATP-binding protein